MLLQFIVKRENGVMENQNVDKPNLDGLPATNALDTIGDLVDLACDTDNLDLVEHALELAHQLEACGLRDEHRTLLDYFRANAWACRYQRRYRERDRLWDFEQPEIQQQILLLRRAAQGPGFAAIEPTRQCQILTNLGNQFDTVGRFVDARACWSSALAIDPKFWMARANRGGGLMFYASALYDAGHEGVFALRAHDDLAEAAQTHGSLDDRGLREVFEQRAEQIAQRYDLDAIRKSYEPMAWPFGQGQTEQVYRRWCLKHTLFLNPLNDVDPAPIAAQDILSLPSFVLPAGEPPIVTGMFNELKQLFASARWLLWEAMHSEEMHFSDRGVLLFNTLDYPSYGLSVEKAKTAFRLGYSIFDKIAYFLNFYLGLRVAERQISFRTIWREKEGGPLRVPIAKSENWPLRGLYWLSKDLFEKDVKGTTEPDARALAELRNHLEHKYVKVHMTSVPAGGSLFHDNLAYRITRSDLETKTLRLLQLARSALVYLSLAMHQEERQRAKRRNGLSAPIPLDVWRDEWKR
ncbi:MAG: hypothetical protein JNK68_02690 [Betaproteobacteria bacterium]|nr:hypothetical protein [Betaproteobacteria bacterium]